MTSRNRSGHAARRCALAAFLAAHAIPADAATVTFTPADPADGRGLWAVECGIAWITENTIDDVLLRGEASRAQGRAAGELYSFTLSRRFGELRTELGGAAFRTEVEFPFTLEIVDEAGRAPFPDFNAAVMLRWPDFPWNDRLSTTFAAGVGLSYSTHVYQIDIDRHPGEDRSRLKFHLPLQLTFALPDHPRHQLLFFLSHQSGGHIFDQGGVNSVGVGYRFGF